jgi:hypothetical protein
VNVIKLKYSGMDNRRKTLIFAVTVSLLFHFFLFLLLNLENVYHIDLREDPKNLPHQVTLLFSENKPKQIVENLNPNQEVPDESDYLSERNSRARNESLLEQRQNQPSSDGNTPLANLSLTPSPDRDSYVRNSGPQAAEKFDRSSLLADDGFRHPEGSQMQGFEPANQETYVRKNDGTNNLLDRQDFSADELGSLTLSTYAWEWASYINYFRRKLYQVWRTPPAYFSMGMISGQTVIRLTIDRNGRKVSSRVLEHQGHSSLQVSSENAVNGGRDPHAHPYFDLSRSEKKEELTCWNCSSAVAS